MEEMKRKLKLKTQRRVDWAVQQGACIFFQHQSITFCFYRGQFYSVQSRYSYSEIATLNLKTPEQNSGVVCTPIDTFDTVVRPSSHAIDRLIERCPVFRCRTKSKEYILECVEAAKEAGTYYTSMDGSVVYLHKQFVYLTKNDTVMTSIRRCKVHDLALMIFRESNRPVPVCVTSKKTKFWLLG